MGVGNKDLSYSIFLKVNAEKHTIPPIGLGAAEGSIMIRSTLPEMLSCPEVSVMTGNAANVTATVSWPILKHLCHHHHHTHTVCTHSESGLDKISF